jgi:transposase
MRQTLLTEFRHVFGAVRSGSYPYRPREPTPIPWHRYDLAQVNELPEVISLMGRLVDAADVGVPPGRGCAHPKAHLAKLILTQQYDGRCNRNSIGLLSLMGEKLGIPSTRNQPSYKTLERAYDDPAVIGILNEIFFLTQRPVSLRERRFAVDGTCFPTTIKENWESAKRRFLKKRGGRRVFEKTVIACGTTFKIIAGFAVASTPHANDSPYLKPILAQIRQLYRDVSIIAADPAFLSRENCGSVAGLGAKARIMPKGNLSLKAKGVKAWRDMLVEFTRETQSWLRDYHTRSIAETVTSTMKRVNPTPLRKKLIIRRAVELLARICVYNLRQLTYLKYTHNIQLEFDTATPN